MPITLTPISPSNRVNPPLRRKALVLTNCRRFIRPHTAIGLPWAAILSSSHLQKLGPQRTHKPDNSAFFHDTHRPAKEPKKKPCKRACTVLIVLSLLQRSNCVVVPGRFRTSAGFISFHDVTIKPRGGPRNRSASS